MGISADVTWRENMKGWREKGEKLERKRKKQERLRENGSQKMTVHSKRD
jgi:hypothetical protein